MVAHLTCASRLAWAEFGDPSRSLSLSLTIKGNSRSIWRENVSKSYAKFCNITSSNGFLTQIFIKFCFRVKYNISIFVANNLLFNRIASSFYDENAIANF